MEKIRWCDLVSSNYFRMALSKLSRGKRISLKLLLAEEIEEEQLVMDMYGKKRAQTHYIFNLRSEEGMYNQLIVQHLREDPKKFSEFFRLSSDQFDFLVELVKDDLSKQSTNFRLYPITPEEKIAVTLRFLATGESLHSLQFQFRISVSEISQIIRQTLAALRKQIVPLFLPSLTSDDLQQKAKEFQSKWQFPNCCGAIDGKHVRIVCPKRSGSLCYNYKGYFSTVLLAIVDANCKFMFVDIGSYGKEGDPGIFERSSLGKKFYSGNLLPPPSQLPHSDLVLPNIFVGDDAFRLHPNMLKPYPRSSAVADNAKAVFNYRLCRARRTSENAFGLLCQVFRIFYTAINLNPETVDNVVIVCCCLHNMLRDAYGTKSGAPNYDQDPTQQLPTENFINLARARGFADYEAFAVRNSFAAYFTTDGSVSWQNDIVHMNDRN